MHQISHFQQSAVVRAFTVEIGTTPAGTTSYSDGTTSGSTGYSYRVRARDGAGNNSNYSSVAVVTTPDSIAPTDPSSLSGSSPNSTTANLSWTGSTDTGGSGLASYRVERCTGSGCSSFAEIGSTASTSYSDTTVSGTTTYVYRVRARDGAGNNSNYSNSATVSTGDTIAPTVPTVLTGAAANSTTVNLSWGGSTDSGGSGLAGYRIYRGGSAIGTSATASYSDTTTSGSTTYAYTVRAYDNATNESSDSNTFNVTTPDTIAPSVPTSLTASAVSPSQINLTWIGSTDTGGSGLAGYKIYRGGVFLTSTTATSFSDTGLAASTAYSYQVTAYDNANNESSLSTAGNATTWPPPPVAPVLSSNKTILLEGQSYLMSWTAVSGATSYRLLRNGGGGYVEEYSGTALSKLFTSALPGDFDHVAQACNASGCSVDSNVKHVQVCPAGGCQ